MLRTQVSRLLEIGIETIRYYEGLNLISKPRRLSNGYRSYSDKNIEEIKFIQHCRSLDIGLDEIKILQVLIGSKNDCSSANSIIEKNLMLIEHKIINLNQLHKQLKDLSKRCKKNGATTSCGIMKSLVINSLTTKNAPSKKPKAGYKN